MTIIRTIMLLSLINNSLSTLMVVSFSIVIEKVSYQRCWTHFIIIFFIIWMFSTVLKSLKIFNGHVQNDLSKIINAKKDYMVMVLYV